MKWIMENLYLFIAALAAVGSCAAVVYRFLGQPREKQAAKVKEWLIWACVEAEKQFKTGTGQLKLREVWNLFCAVPAFGFVAKLITFETFSGWVAQSLAEVKLMLVNNPSLAEYVYGDKAADEVEKIKAQLESKG